jgi:hypothetical protein
MIECYFRLPPSIVTTLILIVCSFVGAHTWRVTVDCRCRYQNDKTSKGDAFFKTIKICTMFEKTRMDLVNHVSSTHWQELRGLSPQPLHILRSALHSFLLTSFVFCATILLYPTLP